jgi:hypothetical protein
MNGRRATRQSAGWGTVVMVAFLGVALAALVVLTPWRIGGPGSAPDRLSTPAETVQQDAGRQLTRFGERPQPAVFQR